MQVIMLKDVGGVGKRGTLQTVADGYGLNYLIARGLAEQATPAKIAALDTKNRQDSAAQTEREKEWAAIAKKLDGKRVAVVAKASPAGSLYTQLSTTSVTEGIKNALNVDVPPDAIVINAPVKQIGDTTVEIRFGSSRARITVRVISEA